MEDNIILFENMDAKVAAELIKRLSVSTTIISRYKFVFTANKEFIISRADIKNSDFMELERSDKTIIAGSISFTFDEDKQLTEVYLNNQSENLGYQPFENLKEPQILLTKLFGPISVDMEDVPKPVLANINLCSLEVH